MQDITRQHTKICQHEVLDAGQSHYCDWAQVEKLRSCVFDRPHELGLYEQRFLVAHQQTELVFTQIYTELRASMVDVEQLRLDGAIEKLGCCSALIEHAARCIATTTTIPKPEFSKFVQRLRPASGAESIEFRKVEIVSGMRADTPYVTERGVSFSYRAWLDRAPGQGEGQPRTRWLTPELDELLQQESIVCKIKRLRHEHPEHDKLGELLAAFREYEQAFNRFRMHQRGGHGRRGHYETALEMMTTGLGEVTRPGTGMTTGLRYLESVAKTASFYPELRNELLPTESGEVVLSGIQPSGALHIGNYFGAIAQHILMGRNTQDRCYFFIADLHALTTQRDAQAMRENVLDVAATYLAFGLDVERTPLFRQSDISEVTELAWLLSSVTGMGLLERAHSYKDKIGHGIKPSVGLFTYPVLMSADILLYQSSVVPVGKDQVQHIEMAQDMAGYFNEAFGGGTQILRRPEARLSPTPYVTGTDGRKMSKSYGNTIPLFLSGHELWSVVSGITTDSTPLGRPLPLERVGPNGEVEVEYVYSLLQLFCSSDELAEIRNWYRTGERHGRPFGWGHAKRLLADKIEERFVNARERRKHLLEHPDQVEAVLRRSAEKARVIARATLEACKYACGLL